MRNINLEVSAELGMDYNHVELINKLYWDDVFKTMQHHRTAYISIPFFGMFYADKVKLRKKITRCIRLVRLYKEKENPEMLEKYLVILRNYLKIHNEVSTALYNYYLQHEGRNRERITPEGKIIIASGVPRETYEAQRKREGNK